MNTTLQDASRPLIAQTRTATPVASRRPWFEPTGAEVSALTHALYTAHLINGASATMLLETAATLRDSSVPAATEYRELIDASRVSATAAALQRLAQLFDPTDVIELGAKLTDGWTGSCGRLGVPEERARMEAFIQQHLGGNSLYYGVNPRADHMAGRSGRNARAKANDVLARRFLAVDLDFKSAPPKDPHWERIGAKLQAMGPSLSLNSGNGLQFLFRLTQAGDGPSVTDEQLRRALKAIGSDPVHDAPRVMRMPLTINVPDKRKRDVLGYTLKLACPLHPIDGPSPREWNGKALCDELEAVAARDGLVQPAAVARRVTAGDGTARVPAPVRVPVSALNAPNEKSLIDLLSKLQNTYDDRNDFVRVASAVRGASRGTGFEASARDAFLAFADRWEGSISDPAENARIYDTLKDVRSGWRDLLRLLAEQAPNEAARLVFANEPLDLEEVDRLSSAYRAADADIPKWMRQTNARYAYIESHDRIADIDPATGQIVKYLTPEQFRTRLANKRVFVDGKAMPLGQAWLASPWRRQYVRTGWWPVGEEPQGALNLFTGLPIRSGYTGETGWRPLQVPLTDALSPTLDFIRDVIARGNAGDYGHVLSWMAWKVQNPCSRPGTALALVGSPGTGKSTMAEMLMDLFGPNHAKQFAKAEQVLGRFNAAMEGAMLVVLEEAFFGRDPTVRGAYKDMVTNSTVNIERKGLELTIAPNMAAFLITSNEMSSIPHEPNERRTTFLRVSDCHRGDASYFAQLRSNWTSGGREAFLQFLLERDVSQFNPGVPLSTPEKAEAAGENGDLVVQFWSELLEDGRPPIGLDPTSAPPDWNTQRVFIQRDTLHSAFQSFVYQRGAKGTRLPNRNELVRRIHELCPGMKPNAQKRDGLTMLRGCEVPPLAECRAELTRALGG